MNKEYEPSQFKKPISKGIKSSNALNLPRLDWQYLNEIVWDFHSSKSWHTDIVLKMVWSPEKQERLFETGVFVLNYILDNYPITRSQLHEIAIEKNFSWVTIRNITLPRLKRLGMIKELRTEKQIMPNSDFAAFFKKMSEEWIRILADHNFKIKNGNKNHI